MTALAPSRGRRFARSSSPAVLALAACVTALTLAAVAFRAGRVLAGPATAGNPIENMSGVPVGVEDSPAGAVVAADEYVAVSYATVERDPGQDTRLIDTVYVPAIRASAIRGAAAVRAQNPDAMRLWAHGGRDISLIGARRLDFYTGNAAQVTTWNADVFWGPGRAPKQSWVLTRTRLRWSDGRWLVTSTTTLPTDGPVPAATPQSSSAPTTASAFTTDLGGFTSPGYGAAG